MGNLHYSHLSIFAFTSSGHPHSFIFEPKNYSNMYMKKKAATFPQYHRTTRQDYLSNIAENRLMMWPE